MSSIKVMEEGATNSVDPVAGTADSLPTVAEQSASQYPTGLKLVIIMASLMLGTSLMSLDTTIISVATPKISSQFHALDDVGWYGAAYLMILTASTPIAANIYKNFNPKYVYLAYIAVFEGTPQQEERPSHLFGEDAISNLVLILRSRIHRLCFGTFFARFHHRQSHRRFGGRRTSPGSIWHFDIRVYPRDAPTVPRHGG